MEQRSSDGSALPWSVLCQQQTHAGLPVQRRTGRVGPFGLFALMDCSGFTPPRRHPAPLARGRGADTAPYEAALVVAGTRPGGLLVADTATVDVGVLVGAGGEPSSGPARRPFRRARPRKGARLRLPWCSRTWMPRAPRRRCKHGERTRAARTRLGTLVLLRRTYDSRDRSSTAGPRSRSCSLLRATLLVLQGPLRLPLFPAVVSPGRVRVEGDVVLDDTLFVARDSVSIGAAPPYGNLSPSLVGARRWLRMARRGQSPRSAFTLGSGTHLSYPWLVTDDRTGRTHGVWSSARRRAGRWLRLSQ